MAGQAATQSYKAYRSNFILLRMHLCVRVRAEAGQDILCAH